MAQKLNIKERYTPKATGIARGQDFTLSTSLAAPALPERAGALPERLQDIARSYLGARRQSGVSLLEAARWLSEARQEAKHGEWAIFLEAIGLDESRARAQIRIHEEAQRDSLFADRIINGFLSETVARELLPALPEVRDQVLARDTPPTLQDVRDAKRALTPVLESATLKFPADLIAQAESLGIGLHPYDEGRSAFFDMPDGRTDRGNARDLARIIQRLMPAPVLDPPMLPEMPPPPAPTDLPPEYDIIKRRLAAHDIALLSNMQGQHRAFVTRKEGMTGIVTFDWANVLSKLERLEATPEPSPSEMAFRMTCPTCGETILNGTWGDLKECGSCWHKRQRAPITPDGAAEISAPDLPIDFSIVQHRFAAHGIKLRHDNGTYILLDRAGAESRTRVWDQVLDRLSLLQDGMDDEPASDPPPPPRPASATAAAYAQQEERDSGRLLRARTLIGNGEYDAARVVLSGIEVSTMARDQVLSTIPIGREITLAFTHEDCTALLREAKAFEQGGLTKKLPTIGQALVLMIEAIKGATA